MASNYWVSVWCTYPWFPWGLPPRGDHHRDPAHRLGNGTGQVGDASHPGRGRADFRDAGNSTGCERVRTVTC